MKEEPTYVRQTAEPEHLLASVDWFQNAGTEAKAMGCTWFRFGVNVDGSILIIEGWPKRPAEEGPLRFMVAKGECDAE